MAGIKGKQRRSSTQTLQHVSLIFFFSMILPGAFRTELIRQRNLIILAFAGSIGMTLVILACALPEYSKWWPFFVVLFYVLAPIPTLMARRYADPSSGSNSCLEAAIFITMGIIVSSFALPIVLARVGSILWGACYLTLAGNFVSFATLIGFFLTFDQDDSDYNMW